MHTGRRVLIIDDDAILRKALRTHLASEGYEPSEAGDGAEGLRMIDSQRPDLALLDIMMPGKNGIEVLREIAARHAGLPVVMVSGHEDLSMAIEAMKLGAQDFIQKPFKMEHLLHVIKKTFDAVTLSTRVSYLDERFESSLELIMGRSKTMRSVIAEIRKVADTNLSIVISGETGTGKTYLANLIHNLSRRMSRPFITVDFGTIPESLVESEMFGFERGSFTGAEKTTPGYFEKAHGGTIFIDELQNIGVATQQKLLKVIEDRGFYTIGGSKRIGTDFRVICATNCNVQDAVRAGRIRSDLFYRISEYSIELPPLRDRAEDIPMFVEKFLIDLGGELGRRDLGVTDEAMSMLGANRWDGNIRELKNVIRSAIVGSNTSRIGAGVMRAALASRSAAGQGVQRPEPAVDAQPISIREAERQAIILALRHTGGNRTRAAAILEITLKTLIKKIREYGVAVPKP